MKDIFRYEHGGFGTRYRLTDELCEMSSNNVKCEITIICNLNIFAMQLYEFNVFYCLNKSLKTAQKTKFAIEIISSLIQFHLHNGHPSFI